MLCCCAAQAFAAQGSDEESDVDDEEREVEAYDRQLADAEYVALPPPTVHCASPSNLS